MSSNCVFKLSDYDVIAFDFDNTIAKYNLSNLFQLHHSYLTSYLIEKKHYNGLSTIMTSNHIDIIRKGLFIDIDKGNVLSISYDGRIMQASHGSRKLDKNEIISIYGEKMHWYATDNFINDKIISVKSNVIYSFNDFTDISALSVYIKAIDFIDNTNIYTYRSVWQHLLEAINNMYKVNSDFIITVGNQLTNYIYKCDQELINWLNNLNNTSKLIIITSAQPETFKPLAKYCLGTGWQTLFHTIIDKANKPSFFTDRNPFIDCKTNEKLMLNNSAGYYSQGNWYDLYGRLTEEFGKPVKCLYIGDNILHDIYGPATAVPNTLDTISIAEETLAEGIFRGEYEHTDYVRSDFWGSYFWHQDGTPTIMGDIIMKHSKLCVPQLNYFIDKPLDYQHTPFWISHQKTFHSNY